MTDKEIADACARGAQYCSDCRKLSCTDNTNAFERTRCLQEALEEALDLLAKEGYQTTAARLRAKAGLP